MSSTVGALLATGQVKATNANLDVRTVGFKPRKVQVENRDNNVKIEWDETLADGYAVKTIADGTRSLVTSAGITPLAADSNGNPGFRIGALADINDTTTEKLAWSAWGN